MDHDIQNFQRFFHFVSHLMVITSSPPLESLFPLFGKVTATQNKAKISLPLRVMQTKALEVTLLLPRQHTDVAARAASRVPAAPRPAGHRPKAGNTGIVAGDLLQYSGK